MSLDTLESPTVSTKTKTSGRNSALPHPVTASPEELDRLCINTIRTLSTDGTAGGNLGYPGTPMALAPVAYHIWQKVLRYDPEDPAWPNRDRFVMSGAHAILLHSLLHLTGVKRVSREHEVRSETSGPVGHALGKSVGLAIAAAWMASRYNAPGFEELIDYNVYALCGDASIMDEASREAASLAACLKLSHLCWIYDNTSGPIPVRDVATRFFGCGWNVLGVADDPAMLQQAFETFQRVTDRPTLIVIDTHRDLAGSNERFQIQEDVYENFRNGIRKSGAALRDAWFDKVRQYKLRYPDKAEELYRMQDR